MSNICFPYPFLSPKPISFRLSLVILVPSKEKMRITKHHLMCIFVFFSSVCL